MKRLTKDQFAQLREHCDKDIVEFAKQTLDQGESIEFLHGLAAGLLMALDIYQSPLTHGSIALKRTYILSSAVAAIEYAKEEGFREKNL